jgi:dTDP-4-dehydrorhamnose 3,5-epimerase
MTVKSHLSVAGTSELEDVEGFSSAKKLQSMTDADGALRTRPIAGVVLRLTRPVSHDKGYLTEVFRADWGIADFPVVQVNATTTFPGHVRAWGIHRNTTDRLFAAAGSFCIAVFDGRRDSPTFGCANQFFLGGKNQGLVVIPPGLWHGWKNIGTDEATIISMPSQLYDHQGPDRWELPWNSAEARRIIPYQWPGEKISR